MCGESSTDRNTSTHSEDRVGEMGGIATNRQRDKQRKTGRAADTQQADGGAREPQGSPVMKTVGNSMEGVHIMCGL